MHEGDVPLEGGCACEELRYRILREPIIVHCCHCSLCQGQTGSAFAVNILVETEMLEVLSGKPVRVGVPSPSGRGQTMLRCPSCQVALWSHYGAAGEKLAFVRAGTLDEPGRIRPDIHIYTTSKQPWVELGSEIPAVPEYYKSGEQMSEHQFERLRALRD